jgi:REP element-mobilizing transposase RayT
MIRDVQVSAGAGHGLGLHVVWCPKCRRTVLEGQVGACLRELIEAKAADTLRMLRAGFPHLRSPLSALSPKSYSAATAGAVSAAMVQRYIQTQYERPWRKERRC